jgi:mono/diheme cytochrome c family protein
MPVGTYETFADGFAGRTNFTNTRDARFRPGGVAVGPDGSLYVGDTEKGRIWRIIYTGETTAAATPARVAATPAEATPPPVVSLYPRGQALYAQICAACHMADGNGVSNMQPSLRDSSVARGDATLLIRVLLNGPAAVLPADRPKYSNVMPPFAVLTDEQIADVLSHVRQVFGGGASAITPAQVAAVRAAEPKK